jgi:hypothetical protein
MALNRGLYKSQGTNIVSQGTMSQRWLLDSSGVVTTTADEFGRPVNATVGRGIVGFSGGARVANPVFGQGPAGAQTGYVAFALQDGTWAHLVNATAEIEAYNQTHLWKLMPELSNDSVVWFSTWEVDGSPQRTNAPASAAPTPNTLTPGTYPNMAANQVVTTIPNVPVTLTAGTVVKTGLTMTFTVSAPAPTTAGAFTLGRAYTIATIGTTDFTTVGAASNTIGTTFIATAAGAGTGTATSQAVATGVFDQSAADIRALCSGAVPGVATTYTISVAGNYGNVAGYTAAGVAVPVTAGSSSNIGTLAVTAPSPVWVSVNLEFTTSAVPA